MTRPADNNGYVKRCRTVAYRWCSKHNLPEKSRCLMPSGHLDACKYADPNDDDADDRDANLT